jgi:ferritin-like metal-binding protein YciE
MPKHNQKGTNDYFVNRLDNAHAIEKDLEQKLEREIDDADSFPEIQAKYRQHLAETKRHLEVLKQLLNKYDSSPSKLKSGFASMAGAVKDAVGGMHEDKPLKDLISNYAMEHAEIGAYKSLVISAKQLGDHEAADRLGEILDEEKEMADWLQERIPDVTRHYTQELS